MPQGFPLESSADRGGGVRRLLTAGAVSGLGIFSGALIALFPGFAILFVGAGVAALLAMVPLYAVLGSVLTARNLTDPFSSQSVIDAGAALELNPSAVIGIVILGLALLRAVRSGHSGALRVSIVVVLALTAWCGVGIAEFGLEPSLTRELLRTASIVGVAYLAATTSHPDRFDRLIPIVLLAAVLPAAVAIVQLFIQDLPLPSAGSTSALTTVADARPSGTLAHANAAAVLFAICVSLAIWRLRTPHFSYRYLAAAALFTLALLSTQSIGGLLQLIVTLLAYAALRPQRASSRTAAAAVAATVLLVAFALSPLGADRLSGLATTQSFSAASTGVVTNSADWRFLNWSRYLEAWQTKPLLGHGLGAAVEQVTPLDNIPHNDSVRILIEGGIIGFLVAALAYFWLLRRLLTRSRSAISHRGLARLVLANYLGLSVHSLVQDVTLDTAAMYVVAVLVGSTLALPVAGRLDGRSTATVPSSRPA